MAICPRCHQPVRTERFGVYLPQHKARIVDAIKQAGDIGITPAELIFAAWPHGAVVNARTVKAHVWQINELLAGTDFEIHSDRSRGQGRYCLARKARVRVA